jgi:hypothetical protein
MSALNTLFGSQERVRIMRLFLFNSEEVFDLDLVCDRSKVSTSKARSEISVLEKAGLVKGREFYKIIIKKNHSKITENKKRVHGFILNTEFAYMSALKQLLMNTQSLEGGDIVKRLSKAGKLKLVIVAGVFIQDPQSRVDILVVGDRISKNVLDKVVKNIESEIGKELTYAYFDVQDYQYRFQMYDKLIRDILDYPHDVLLDKIKA